MLVKAHAPELRLTHELLDSWAADAANQGLNGQGYIVHSAMLVDRSNRRLTWTIIGLMLVQIAVAVGTAVWPALRGVPR